MVSNKQRSYHIEAHTVDVRRVAPAYERLRRGDRETSDRSAQVGGVKPSALERNVRAKRIARK